jgi:hypothetical protein
MVKRKKQRKIEQQKTARTVVSQAMPVPLVAIKALSIFLSIIMIVALTLYVLGKIPARGFWVLVVLLAVVAFFVLPAMRKRFGG